MTRLLALLAAVALTACSAHRLPSAGEPVAIETAHGPFTLGVYPAAGRARAALLLASGDGGWTDFEEKMARALAADGFAVVGWDSRRYAGLGAYDAAALARDMRAALGTVRHDALPVVLAGYSTGTEQVTAFAAGPSRPARLAGLLLLAPGHRGRYGIKASDLLGIPPTGPDTFALADLAPALAGVPVFQIHGEHDPLAQTEWLDRLPGPHHLEVYPDGWHNFRGAPPDFLDLVVRGAQWVLRP